MLAIYYPDMRTMTTVVFAFLAQLLCPLIIILYSMHEILLLAINFIQSHLHNLQLVHMQALEYQFFFTAGQKNIGKKSTCFHYFPTSSNKVDYEASFPQFLQYHRNSLLLTLQKMRYSQLSHPKILFSSSAVYLKVLKICTIQQASYNLRAYLTFDKLSHLLNPFTSHSVLKK